MHVVYNTEEGFIIYNKMGNCSNRQPKEKSREIRVSVKKRAERKESLMGDGSNSFEKQKEKERERDELQVLILIE